MSHKKFCRVFECAKLCAMTSSNFSRPVHFPHSACRVEVCGRIVAAPCFRVILPDSDESCVPISIGSIEFNDGRSFRCVDVTRTVVISESRQSRPSVPSHYRCIVITATIYIRAFHVYIS